MSEFRRRLMMVQKSGPLPQYAITKATNPKVMTIVYAQGWAANENYMTFEEAAAVTSVGTVFNGTDIDGFDEFQYFTGLTSLNENSFRNCKMTSIIVPEGVRTFGLRSFSNCTRLQNITFPSTLTHTNYYFLYGASSLNWIKCYATTAPIFGAGAGNFLNIKSNGVLYHPIGSDYSSWFTNNGNMLTNRGWTDQTF